MKKRKGKSILTLGKQQLYPIDEFLDISESGFGSDVHVQYYANLASTDTSKYQ